MEMQRNREKFSPARRVRVSLITANRTITFQFRCTVHFGPVCLMPIACVHHSGACIPFEWKRILGLFRRHGMALPMDIHLVAHRITGREENVKLLH